MTTMQQQISILLADCGGTNPSLLADLCLRLGYRCHTARDGQGLIETARRERPCLIITDNAMPDIAGWEAAGWLKADPATAAIPIILVTELGWAGSCSDEAAAGPDYLLTRPFTPQQLLDSVHLFIG